MLYSFMSFYIVLQVWYYICSIEFGPRIVLHLLCVCVALSNMAFYHILLRYIILSTSPHEAWRQSRRRVCGKGCIVSSSALVCTSAAKAQAFAFGFQG